MSVEVPWEFGALRYSPRGLRRTAGGEESIALLEIERPTEGDLITVDLDHDEVLFLLGRLVSVLNEDRSRRHMGSSDPLNETSEA